jgi:uncharacterized protein involved in exopolysaccharide biosynthesis
MSLNNPITAQPGQASPAYAYPDDEISLLEILNILREQWKWVVGLAVLAPIIALAVSLTIPSLYQAEVLLQVGRVPSGSGSGSAPVSSVDIEAPSQLAQRVSSGGFAVRLKDQVHDSFSLKVVEVKNTRLLRLEARADTPEKAREGLEKSITLIQADHSEAVRDARKSVEDAIRNAREELQSVTRSIEQLNKSVIAMTPARQDPISALLLTQTQNQLISQRIELVNRLSALESALSAQNTQLTRAAEPIQAGSTPVYPKTQLILVIALLAGGFAGMLMAFLVNALKNAKKALPQAPA